MMAADTVLQQYFTELQSEVKAIAVNADLETAYTELEGAFTEQVSRLMSEMGLLAAEPELCPFQGTVNGAVARVSAYAVSDDLDRMDVFVTLYESSSDVFEVKADEAQRAASQCLLFLRACVDGTLTNEIPSGGRAAAFAALVESCWKGLDQIRIWIVTNGLVKNARYKPQEIAGKLVTLEVVDLLRLSRMALEGEKGDPINVDFSRECGEALPCVFYSDEKAPYDTALCLLPGEVLRSLYEKYDARLLEANVRSYLSIQSKVNKGMFTTLKEHPEDFLAFNNGIVIVAEQLQLSRTSIGTTGIKVLAGIKIVNGGQTSATLFFGKRRDRTLDLSHIRIPAKIIVLKPEIGDHADAFLTDIARFANTQNNVRASDLSSSSPFHLGLEHLARTTWCPDGEHQWFYERTTGSYRTMLAKERTPAERKHRKQLIPPSNRITKLDLAKIMNAWFGRPELVCLSPQKNYALFMKALDDQGGADQLKLTPGTWKDIVAVAVIFRECQKIAKKEFSGSSLVITASTVAIASRRLAGKLRLRRLWEQQSLSPEFLAQLEAWAKEINATLRLSSLGKPISEWGRDPECWKFVQESIAPGYAPGIPELEEQRSAQTSEQSVSGPLSAETQTDVASSAAKGES